MADRRWTATTEMKNVHLTQVFSGGACNILDDQGKLLRNTERDAINDWLTARKINFFDPQIHPDTHGLEYDYTVHHHVEMAARRAAKVNVYELSPRTFGGITSLEIAADYFQAKEPMVLYYSDGYTHVDRIPEHNEKGHPLFVPYGVGESVIADRAHYKEMRKNANNMRAYLMRFARDLPLLSVTFSGRPRPNDIVISSDRMHAADIFEAVVQSLKGKRTFVHFDEDDTKRDMHGNPLFIVPGEPRSAQLSTMLDQYIDEGNRLRQRIAELLGVNVFLRVVYTQRSAIIALEELLYLAKLLVRE